MKKAITYLSVISLIILLIVRGSDVVLYTHNALSICYEMIIPTLFPFFICSGILIYSGFCESLSKLFRPLMKPLFGINPSGSAAFILGIISGYPLGAITVCQLYQSSYLSKNESERLLAFCNNSGPLFILCSVGTGLFYDIKIGILLYISHFLSAVTVGIILKLVSKPIYNPAVGDIKSEEKSIGEIFSVSLNNSIQSILTVCGAVVFFSVVSSLILDYIPDFKLKSVLYAILEFASGNSHIAKSSADIITKLILSSITIGFAGICVHIQVLGAVASYGLKMRTYIIGKILHGAISGLYTYIIIKTININIIKKAASVSFGYSFFINSVLILTLTGILLLICLVLKSCRHQALSRSQKPLQDCSLSSHR